MKIAIFNGSPRKEGNTARALTEMISVFNEEGVEVEYIQMRKLPEGVYVLSEDLHLQRMLSNGVITVRLNRYGEVVSLTDATGASRIGSKRRHGTSITIYIAAIYMATCSIVESTKKKG